MLADRNDVVALAAAALGAICWVVAPILAFLGGAPEETVLRLGGGDLAALLAALGVARWGAIILGGVAFVAGLACFGYLLLARWRARRDKPTPERDAEHMALHERLYKDQEELRQLLERERLGIAAEREALAERLHRAEDRLAELEKRDGERGELMATLERMLSQLAQSERRETPRGERQDAALKKRLDEIRRGLLSDL